MYIVNGRRNRKKKVMNCKRKFCLLKQNEYMRVLDVGVFLKRKRRNKWNMERKKYKDGEEEG